jgi:serine/threonine protein kinase
MLLIMSQISQSDPKSIVDQGRRLDPQERRDYVHRACAGDEQLFLTVMAELGTVLPSMAADDKNTDVNSSPYPQEMTGTRMGPYRVVRCLGAGGMGEVFLAERADAEFEQQVAIKIVRGGGLARGVQSRLKIERQILAQLDHPNIAHIS